MQTHAQESLYERLDGPRHGGGSHIEKLYKLGVLSPRLSLAHCTWASEGDLTLLAETGACISHNPSSNLRLRAGHGAISIGFHCFTTVLRLFWD